MAVNLNKAMSPMFDEFMTKHNAPGAPKITNGPVFQSRSVDLFTHLDTMKTIVGYLRTIGLDPFKKGTKEPIRIQEALDKVDWETIKDGPQGGRSMFDSASDSFNAHVSRLFTKELEVELINNKEDYPDDNRPYAARLFNAGGVGTWHLKEISEYRMRKGEDFKAVYTFKERIDLQEEGYIIDDVIVYGFANLGDDQNAEFGDISLKALAALNHMGMGVERDKFYDKSFNLK